jgi:hypothetical protein
MKKCFLIFFMLKISFSFGQSYTPFPDSNAVWVNHHYSFGSGWPDYIDPEDVSEIKNYCVNGVDTIIGSETYTQVTLCGSNYVGAIRDNGGQIFYIPADSIDEELLYDFTVQVGDTIPYAFDIWSYSEPLIVQNIDSTFISGTYRTIISFENGGDYWIEGIGCIGGLFISPFANVNISGNSLSLYCFSANGERLISQSNPGNFGSNPCGLYHASVEPSDPTITLFGYPNPTSGFFFIDKYIISSIESLIITNNLGQKINPETNFSDSKLEIDLSKYPSGIYFMTLTNEHGKFTQKIFKQ